MSFDLPRSLLHYSSDTTIELPHRVNEPHTWSPNHGLPNRTCRPPKALPPTTHFLPSRASVKSLIAMALITRQIGSASAMLASTDRQNIIARLSLQIAAFLEMISFTLPVCTTPLSGGYCNMLRLHRGVWGLQQLFPGVLFSSRLDFKTNLPSESF